MFSARAVFVTFFVSSNECMTIRRLRSIPVKSIFCITVIHTIRWTYEQFPVAAVDPTVPIRGISRAYDGDGIYVDDAKIRLWGIDAPELGTPDGDAVLDALATFDARVVQCVPPPWSASYYRSGDRIVALCELAATGADLARVQVISGHAEDWVWFSRGFYSRDKDDAD